MVKLIIKYNNTPTHLTMKELEADIVRSHAARRRISLNSMGLKFSAKMGVLKDNPEIKNTS